MARKVANWTFADATERDTYVGAGSGVRTGDRCVLINDFSEWIYNGTAWQQSGGGLRFDSRTAPASVVSSRFFNFTVDTGGMKTPLVQYLRFYIPGVFASALSGDVFAWTDAGLTNLVYQATGKVFTGVGPTAGHEDGTPWAGFNSNAGVNNGELTGGLLYVQAALPAFLDTPVAGELRMTITESAPAPP